MFAMGHAVVAYSIESNIKFLGDGAGSSYNTPFYPECGWSMTGVKGSGQREDVMQLQGRSA